jgi:transposase
MVVFLKEGGATMITVEVFMDILALKRQGLSNRAIARKLDIHRKTVKKYLEGKKLPAYKKQKKTSVLAPYHQIIKDFLEEDEYQATWIYDRLKNIGYTGSYETLKTYVRPIKEQKNRLAFIRFETEPGHQAQVDFGDFKITEADGSTSTVHAFVMVLGFSRAMYVKFVEHCTLEIFMDCHINAFHYLGGVPEEILYDNMKNVVIKRSKEGVVFNHEFLSFTNHYGFSPKACPPYSPWVKGKVERPMDYIRQRFWRGYHYSSLARTNAELENWLHETANCRLHGTHRQSVNERWQQEKLGNLPPADYDTSIKVYRKVYKDCQLSYNGNRYVIPYHVVGKMVLLKIKHGVIRIYHDQEFLASYREPQGKHKLFINQAFYDQLKHDKEQIKRKYGRNKGKATRGLTTSTLFPQVEYRSPADYDQFAGGVLWN